MTIFGLTNIRFSKHAFDKWESKFSDFLGGMYNEFCHNLQFDSHKKLKIWKPSGTLVVTNNSTHILSELKSGMYTSAGWAKGFSRRQ